MRGRWRLLGLVLTMFVVMSLAFLAADLLGFEDEEAWTSALAPWRANGGGVGGFFAVVLALAVDLVLPVPSSVVMTVSGAWLGGPIGFFANLVGGMVASWAGWGLCRWWGRPGFQALVGGDYATLEQDFHRWGPWVVVLSRGVPMLTEVISCLAGVHGMGFWRFTAWSALGLAPVALTYAFAGAWGWTVPWFALLVAFVLPGIAYAAMRIRG